MIFREDLTAIKQINFRHPEGKRTKMKCSLFKDLANFGKHLRTKTGKTMQFVPENGMYVYFRYDPKQTIMCIMNTNDQPAPVDLSRFEERMNGFTKAYDVATGDTFNLEPKLTLGEKYLRVMELKK